MVATCFALAMVVAMTAGMIGCESTPQVNTADAAAQGEDDPADTPATDAPAVDTSFELDDEPGTPTLTDLQAADPDDRPAPQPIAQTGGMFNQPEANVTPATLQVVRIDLPLNDPLAGAWRLLDTSTVSRAAQATWRLNGLRVGTIGKAHIDDFIDALPRNSGARNRYMRLGGIPVPIASSPRLRGTTSFDLTSPPFPPQQRAVNGGRCRLLAQVDRDQLDRVWLDLIPQHHVPENPLMPRNPLESQLDGTIFKALRLRGPVWPGQCLVLALGPAPQAAPDTLIAPQANPDTDDETDRPNDQNQPPRTEPDNLRFDNMERDNPQRDMDRNDLGWRLFASQRFNQPIQTVLIITTVER